jgi:hypothetical protein
MGSWLRIRIRIAKANPDLDSGGEKSAQKKKKKLSQKTRKNTKITIFYAVKF